MSLLSNARRTALDRSDLSELCGGADSSAVARVPGTRRPATTRLRKQVSASTTRRQVCARPDLRPTHAIHLRPFLF